MYKNILVAVDGSPTANVAVQEATKLAGAGVEITLFSALEDPTWNIPIEYSVAYDIEQMRESLVQSGRNLLEQAQKQLAAQGVTVKTELKDLTWQPGKSIPSAILEVAHDLGADLIVIGTHGRRGFNRLLMGSVAEQVVRLSTLPVLLVRGSDKVAEKTAEKAKVEEPYSDFPEEELMGS